MKIAFLSFYSGAVDRGVEVVTAQLADRLGKNHETVVFQSGSRLLQSARTIIIPVKNAWPPDTSASWLRRFYLDYYSRKIFQFSIRFIPHFLKHRYDVVIPTNGGWQVVVCKMLTWMFGKKMIVQGNAGIGRDDAVTLAAQPDRFVAISPQGYQWARKKMPGARVVYIPYGVDISQMRRARRANLPLHKPIVLCVAALSPFKRIDLLISAMQHVEHASLLVIGQGVQEHYLSELGNRLLGRRFLLKTDVTRAQLPAYYRAADVFSLPSASTEAFGMVQIEALAARLPVVATDDANRQRVIGDAGILVDPTNTIEYARAIDKALREDFGDKPLTQARKFSWDRVVARYEKLLSQL